MTSLDEEVAGVWAAAAPLGMHSGKVAHSDNTVAMPVGCLPSVARPSYLVGMINMSIKHIPPAQIYAFEVGYQARALKFIENRRFCDAHGCNTLAIGRPARYFIVFTAILNIKNVLDRTDPIRWSQMRPNRAWKVFTLRALGAPLT